MDFLHHNLFFFFSSRRRHTRWNCDWSSDVCSSDLSAVLIRAGEVAGAEVRAGSGPGKLRQALRLDRRQNGADLIAGPRLWLEDDGYVPARVARGPRVNVAYAGGWARKPWRFWI